MGFTPRQLAELIGSTSNSIIVMIRKGTIPATRKPNSNYWSMEKKDVVQFLIQNGYYYERFYNHIPSPRYQDSHNLIQHELQAIGIRSYSAVQISDLFGISLTHIRKLTRSAKLISHKSCGQVFYYTTDILEYLKTNPIIRSHFISSKPSNQVVSELKEQLLKELNT